MRGSILESTPCPISGSLNNTPLFQVSDRFNISDGRTWQIVRNEDSGLVYLNPRPNLESIGKYYEVAEYDPFLTIKEDKSLQEKFYEWVRSKISLNWKASMVFKRSPLFDASKESHFSFLDIGCATGDFAATFRKVAKSKKLSLETFGIDVSHRAVQYARNQYEIEAYVGELATLNFTTPQDLITMWHSLEHIHHINQTLDKIKSILKKNGVLAVAMPNQASYDATLYQTHWVAYDAPRHLYHFSPKTFSKLLSRHRLGIIDMHGIPLDSFYNALLSEQLRAKEEGMNAGVGGLIKSVMRGFRAAVEGVTPESASSVVYYIKHQ
ncbi:MAG: class I SAM-dependent methyltransferase [Chloroherpetonaceae bacterium]|nr:class I SAM-dependent methyltransferase [Chloroherpetonaceae bacterium]